MSWVLWAAWIFLAYNASAAQEGSLPQNDTNDAALQKLQSTLQEEAQSPRPRSENKAKKDEIAQQKEQILELQDQLENQQQSSAKDKGRLFQELGLAYAELHDYEKALQWFDDALSHDPDLAESHYCAGLLYHYLRNDPVKARLHLFRYLQLKPDAKNRKSVEFLLGALKCDVTEC